MKHVISIQSQVAFGHVGNSAAVYPMQAHGIEVIAVPTTLLSNHPGYPTFKGRILDAALVKDLLQGLDELGVLERVDMLVTGYLGSPDTARVVADFVDVAKGKNPRLVYVCDPVIGDDDRGVYVNAALPALFAELLVPKADVITPNQFELGLLAGVDVSTPANLEVAASKVRGTSGRMIVATGCVLSDSPPGTVETVLLEPEQSHRYAVEQISTRYFGTGDLFTGLLVAALSETDSFPDAVAEATRKVHQVLLASEHFGTREMSIWAGLQGGVPRA